MSRFVEVPPGRVEQDVLHALLEEFASRDGTDYGESERSLEAKVVELRTQLRAGVLCLVYDTVSEEWDLVPRDHAQNLLAG
jgi:uncharacterized protein YheU (UPF0270 family)